VQAKESGRRRIDSTGDVARGLKKEQEQQLMRNQKEKQNRRKIS
jgi:hypothetical protein